MAAAQMQGQQRYVVGAITTRLTVTVPGSITGGDLVRVAAPDGSYHSVVVPAGLSAGQQFSVELLAGHSEGNAAELAKLRVRRTLPPQNPGCHFPPHAPSSLGRWSWRRSDICEETFSRRRFGIARCA